MIVGLELDRYSRDARLKPALIAAIPAVLLLVAAGVRISMLCTMFLVPLSALGLTLLLAQIGRDQGRELEGQLFVRWGGKPTTRLMRHRDLTINSVTKKRLHNKATELLEMEMPNANEESESPDVSDLMYDSFADVLRDRTRDARKFPLVLQELINYGFRRNLLGLRPLALLIAALALALTAALLLENRPTSEMTVVITSISIEAAIAYFWAFVVNDSWVRVAADAYARQLILSYDSV